MCLLRICLFQEQSIRSVAGVFWIQSPTEVVDTKGRVLKPIVHAQSGNILHVFYERVPGGVILSSSIPDARGSDAMMVKKVFPNHSQLRCYQEHVSHFHGETITFVL